MRKLWGALFILCLLPMALAINVDVKKLSSEETMISGIDNSVPVQLQITNNGPSSNFKFYTIGYFSFSDFNQNTNSTTQIQIDKGETKKVTLLAFKRPDAKLSGKTTFSYFIQSDDKSEVEEKLTINIAELGDSFEIGSGTIDPETRSISIYIKNKLNYDFDKVNVKFSSPFFNLEKEVALKAYESKSFTIELNREDFDKLNAGFYTLNAKVNYKTESANIEGKIEFKEKDLLETKSNNYGFLIVTNVIEKSNEGNTIVNSETTIKKNIFTRLFTTYSPEPTQVEREGTKVYYTWIKKLNPGESIEITVKTNWLLPFLLIFFFVTLVYFTRKYVTQKVQVKKRVSFVKAKGGEFALKVTLIAEAREFVENVRIIDRLPPLVKMFERFGGELPDKISKDKKRLEWHYNYLDAGEKRIMTYIVYSKVGVLGKFALPGAICRYQKEGKEKESNSNKAFFISEQKDRRYLN